MLFTSPTGYPIAKPYLDRKSGRVIVDGGMVWISEDLEPPRRWGDRRSYHNGMVLIAINTIFSDTEFGAIRVTLKNIKMLLALEHLSDEDKEELAYWDSWVIKTRFYSYWMTMARLGAQPVEGIPHRIPQIPGCDPMTHLLDYQNYSPYRLYSQQLVGVEMVLKCHRVALWIDMRVGKTYIAMTAAKIALRSGACRRIVVVCPVMNIHDPWVKTANEYMMDCEVLDGTEADDRSKIGSNVEMLIVNYERLHRFSEGDMLDSFVIFDETSAIKNQEASRSQESFRVSKEATFVVLLNGTPLEQGPEDLWSQMRCVDIYGLLWDRTFSDYCDKWLTKEGLKFVVQRGKGTKFQLHISQTSMRCTRGEADQFSGQDKRCRYIALKPTEEQIKLSVMAEDGETPTFDDEEGIGSMSNNRLAVMTHMREIASGYHKLQEAKGLPFIKRTLEIDPKLLWIRCWLENNSGPLVVFTNYSLAEDRLKGMLDDLGIAWSSTSDKMRSITKYKINSSIPVFEAKKIANRLPEYRPVLEAMIELAADYGIDVQIPPVVSYDESAISIVSGSCLSEWTDYEPVKYDNYRRAREIDDFNQGKTRVFILKTSQGRGLTLNCLPSIRRGGEQPTMVMTGPIWQLGGWDQAMDRAVGVDPSTGNSICTTIYILYCKGSIEERMLNALRGKKDVQSELLADREREGFSSFVDALISDMKEARKGDYFDAEEITARIECGVTPSAQLTKKSLLKAISKKFNLPQKDSEEFAATNLTESYRLLESKCSR